MPLRDIPGSEAIQILRSNPWGRWPGRRDADTNRIEPLCKPGIRSTFKLHRSDRIFTIGSCFARNIEGALLSHGYDVVTSNARWPKWATDLDSDRKAALLNNYGVASIANELRWALDPDNAYNPDHHIHEIFAGKFADMNIAGLSPRSREEVLQVREAILDVTRRVKDCRVVIMTLGLSEVWFDSVTNTYLNSAPPRTLIAHTGDRFRLRVLSFDETLACLQDAIDLLKRFCRPDQHVLLTVSPVPFQATYTEQDCIVANAYSKAVLRTAVEHVVAASAHVDYYPSYESVTLSERNITWADDQVHVERVVIQTNVARMIEAYRGDAETVDASGMAAALNDATAMLSEGEPLLAMVCLEPFREIAGTNPQFAMTYANLCVRLGRPEEALSVISDLAGEQSRWRVQLVRANVLLATGKEEEGIALLQSLADLPNPKIAVFMALARAEQKVGRLREALATVQRWLAIAKRTHQPVSHQPLVTAARIHRDLGDADAALRAYARGFAIIRRTNRAKNAQNILVEYAEFLIERQGLEEAAKVIAFFNPTTDSGRTRLETILSMIPTDLLERHALQSLEE